MGMGMQTKQNPHWRTVSATDVIPPEQSSTRSRPQRNLRVVDVEDAVFEVVGRPPAMRVRVNDNPPPIRNAAASPAAASPWALAAICAVHVFSAWEHWLRKLTPQGYTCLISSLAIMVFWLCGGFGAFAGRDMQPLYGPYAVANLDIASKDLNGMRVAVVRGDLVNRGDEAVALPELTVVSKNRRAPVGKIHLDAGRLAPSQHLAFAGLFQLSGFKAEDLTIVAAPR
jgi:hypothetical protein